MNYKELSKLKNKKLEEELEKSFDDLSGSSRAEVRLQKVLILQQKKQNKVMVICTVLMTIMTAIILFATLQNANIISFGG